MTSNDLAHYKEVIEQEIVQYSSSVRRQTQDEYGQYSEDMVNVFFEILLRGGKRMRGTLVMIAYEMLGGTDEHSVLEVARAVEMIHAYLLIVDDIADRSPLRRGGPAGHVLMEQYFDAQQLKGDRYHFGQSMAMTCSLLGAHLAELTIEGLEVGAETRVQLLRSLHANLIHTVHGQLHDVLAESRDGVVEADALQIATLKTAYYSFVNPLELGAILGGADTQTLNVLRDFGINAGIAFQIADDIIGTFSDEAEIGKSTMSDIEEGKMTILTTYALAHASTEQRAVIDAALGHHELDQQTYNACKDALTQSGALAHARQLGGEYLQKARQALVSAPASWRSEQKALLEGILNRIESQLGVG
jgi:geranylgeranyl pyrophosphate synthase